MCFRTMMFEVKFDADAALAGLVENGKRTIREEIARRLEGVTCAHGDAGSLDVLIDDNRVDIKACCPEREKAASEAIEKGGDLVI